MSPQLFAGIYPILQTPFDERGRIDDASLESQVEFCLRAGAHGIVIPANASEFFSLSDAERRHVAEVALRAARRRIPVIIGVTGVSALSAVEFAQHAAAHGADGVMAMPPYTRKASEAGIAAYYQALSEATELPIIVQNAPAPPGTPLGPAALAKLAREILRLEYVKEEVMPCSQRISALLAQGVFKGVFGGANGLWLIDELRRGACGCMPAAALVDVQVAIYQHFRTGNEARARELQYQLLPLLNLGPLYGVTLPKVLLKRRGVIRTEYVRDPQGTPLDVHDRRELDILWERIELLITVR